MKKRYILLASCLLLAFTGCEEKIIENIKVLKPVKTLLIQSIDNIQNIKTPGTLRAAKRADLSFDVSGKVITLHATEGMKVKKGDIIATLDKSTFMNNYLSAKADLKEAELTLGRYKTLYQQKAIAKANLDRAQKDFDISKAAMKVTQKLLNDTKLRAYFSGTISKRHIENFQNVQAKELIVSIEDKSMLEVVVHAPENAMATINDKEILSMTASFEAIPDKKFPLTIKEIPTKIDPATRTYAVILLMKAPKNYNILSGMTADVEIKIKSKKEKKEKKITIPLTAIFGNVTNETFVWLYTEETQLVSKKQVVLGEMDGDKIEIISGLHNNQIIITAGVNYLVEGMKVRPVHGKMGD